MKRAPAVLILVAIILLSITLYLPPYDTAFVGDDYVQLDQIAEFLDRPGQAYQMFHPYWTTWYYRPLQNLTFLLNRLLFGLQPFGYYVVQAGWHAVTVALVYAVARKLRAGRFAALCGAALFAIHTHHHDVVSWISSIAIIQATAVSLLAILCYLAYLQRRRGRGWPWLLAALLLALFTFTIHEQSLVLLPFLLAVRLTAPGSRRWRRTVSWLEIAAIVLLVPLTLIYLWLQITRPNITIDVGAAGLSTYLPYLLPGAISHYLVTLFGRWTLLSQFATGSSLLTRMATIPFAEILFSAGLLLLLALWFRAGNRPVRLGLLWAALHLTLIYFALWTQRPELLAGRHLYAAWAGFCLAIAGSIQQAAWNLSLPALRNRPALTRPRLLTAVIVLLVLVHVWQIGRSNRAWIAHVEEVAAVEAQMKALLPEVTPQMRLFAYRFVLVPRFFPATVATWYNQPQVRGGTLETLQSYDEVTGDFYLFDYWEDRFYNALPGLQGQPRARLLWTQEPQALHLGETVVSPLAPGRLKPLESAGPAGELRLATGVELPADGWAALGYNVGDPQDRVLRVAVWGPAGTEIRVRLAGPAAAGQMLYEETLAGNGWQELALPLPAPNGQSALIWLDAAGSSTVYWANARLTDP